MDSSREQLEEEISNTALQLGEFENFTPETLESPILIHFIYTARALLMFYEQSNDTTINQDTLGLIVDLPIKIALMPENYQLNQYQQHRAQEVANELETLINDITHAVEQNIAIGRS